MLQAKHTRCVLLLDWGGTTVYHYNELLTIFLIHKQLTELTWENEVY